MKCENFFSNQFSLCLLFSPKDISFVKKIKKKSEFFDAIDIPFFTTTVYFLFQIHIQCKTFVLEQFVSKTKKEYTQYLKIEFQFRKKR